MTNLALISTYDLPGARLWRVCGKLAAASLLRSLWSGELRLTRNFPEPLFPTGRQGLLEMENADFHHRSRMLGWLLEPEPGARAAGPPGAARRREARRQAAFLLRFGEIAAAAADADAFDWVLLMDADCVVLRNTDHLFERPDADVLVTSRQAPDPGFVAVRGPLLGELAARWRAAWEVRPAGPGDGRAASLAAALDGWPGRVRRFETGEVLRAEDGDGHSIGRLKDAAVLHFAGLEPADKRRLAFAFHMMAVYADEDGLFLDMLDS